MKKKSKVKPRKIKIEREQLFRLFPEKKHQDILYWSTHYVNGSFSFSPHLQNFTSEILFTLSECYESSHANYLGHDKHFWSS